MRTASQPHISEIFEDIYQNDRWGFGSGHGSLRSVTEGYRAFLQSFIEHNDIKSVVDYGCGDWQFSRYVNWEGVQYVGLEVVPSLVKRNNDRFASPNVRFAEAPESPDAIPRSDLLLVKDVLQHLTTEAIEDFIEKALPRARYALITNNVVPEEYQNGEITLGSFRPLDLRKPPFLLRATAVYSFGRRRRTFSIRHRKFFDPWQEVVLLVAGDAATAS